MENKKEIMVEYVPLKEIKPYDKNAKKHPAEQIKETANSIKRFGWKQPLVIDKDGIVVVGHCRLLAAKQLGLKTVPCIRADELTDEEISAYRLADNKTNESEWDYEILGDELKSILDIDMSDFGFSDLPDDIDPEDGLEDDGYDKDLPESPKAKRGDIYILGDHRLMCGDSTNPGDVAKLMNGKSSKLLFTSPPYSDMREYRGGKILNVDHLVQFIDVYKKYADFQCVNLGIQRTNNEIVQYWDESVQEAKDCGLKLLAWNVWDKMMAGSIGQQKAMIPIRHEWIFVFGEKPIDLNLTWEKKKSSIYSNGRTRKVRQKDGSMRESTCGVSNRRWKKMESVLEIPDQERLESVTKQCSEVGTIRSKHPATFPIYLPAEYIIAFTDEQDIVIEPFGGSGTTLIACEQLKRKCYICELDPLYVDVIIDRWEEYTGEKAVLCTE